MPRVPRIDLGGYPYHVLNRANGRMRIFHTDGDFLHFETLLADAAGLTGMRILAYCLMPNHWHLVLFPERDRQLAEFMKRVTQVHTQHWHIRREDIGTGHLYQGRYKSFPVEADTHLLQLLRYVERNPVRAQLVPRAEEWRWGSLWRRERGTLKEQKLLSPWPVDMPRDYLAWVNEQDPEEHLNLIRECVTRSAPLGSEGWRKSFNST